MTTAPPPAVSPFAGIPLSDWVRDGSAALLLLVSLALPWSSGFGFGSLSGQLFATSRIEVILVTLLSLFSLALTYLARAGVFPPTVTARTIWALRLVANAPYAIVVLVHIVIDIASQQGTGLGFAAAFGLAGAVLAAQPREAEVRGLPQRDPVAAVWYAIALVFTGLVALTGLLALVLGLVTLGRFGGPAIVLGLIVAVLLNVAAVGVPALGLVRRSEVWRTVAIGLGAALALIVVIDALTGFVISPGGIESVRIGGYLVVLFLPLAAIAASPAIRISMNPVADLTRWFSAAATALLVGAVLAGVELLRTILTLIIGGVGYSSTAPTIISTILLIVILVAAVIARSFLRSNPAGSRYTVPGFAGAIFVLGLINVAISIGTVIGVVPLVLALGVPGIIAYALLVPASVREYFTANAPLAGTTSSYLSGVLPGAPVAPPVPAPPAASPAPAAAVDPLLQRASDPATTAAELHELARDHHELWPAIAANPSAYDALLEWLGASTDPAVQAALRARGR